MRSYRNKTGYKGVTKTQSGKYNVVACLATGKYNLGNYDTAEEAAIVHDVFIEKYKSERAQGNETYKGVNYDRRQDCFCAYYRDIHLGNFNTAAEAALIYNDYLDRFDINQLRNKISIENRVRIKKEKREKQKQTQQSQTEYEMRTPKIKTKHGLEYGIQQAIVRYLQDRGWYVRVFTAGLYNFGFTDLWAAHVKYGQRWIEVKAPVKHIRFTPAQIREFPKFLGHGVPIYIMTAADKKNYDRLFGPSNLWLYLAGINND